MNGRRFRMQRLAVPHRIWSHVVVDASSARPLHWIARKKGNRMHAVL